MMRPLEDLRSIEVADVVKAGRLAGTISRHGGGTRFVYSPDYLFDREAPPVAFTLPKSQEPVDAGAGALPPFFAGLLPEGLRLQAIRTAARTSLDDQLTLLLAVGSDAIGDVQVIEAGTQPDPVQQAVDAADPKLDLVRAFAIASSPELAGLDRSALPGVQAKVSASMLSSPVRATSGPAILKLSPPAYPRLVENEHFFLKVAAEAGIRVPAHQLIHDAAGRAGLLVQRFDRDGDLKLAQEDACQVSGVYPADKYRLSLQSVITDLAAAVKSGGGSAPLTIQQALTIAAFSYVIGNGDLHGKNLSIRGTRGARWELTPAYDLLSTQPYLSFRDPMALPLYGRANRLGRRWWLAAADKLGIPERAMARPLDRIATACLAWSERTTEIGLDVAATERLAHMMKDRSAELASG